MTAVPEPHLTIRAIRPLVAGLHALGQPAGPVLAAAGIDEALLVVRLR